MRAWGIQDGDHSFRKEVVPVWLSNFFDKEFRQCYCTYSSSEGISESSTAFLQCTLLTFSLGDCSLVPSIPFQSIMFMSLYYSLYVCLNPSCFGKAQSLKHYLVRLTLEKILPSWIVKYVWMIFPCKCVIEIYEQVKKIVPATLACCQIYSKNMIPGFFFFFLNLCAWFFLEKERCVCHETKHSVRTYRNRMSAPVDLFLQYL